MPATYQDAVAVTRKLGVSFLWIDSLCIIQDDRDDWDRESAQMADIYSRGFLTIAATRGKSGSAGLFHNYRLKEVCGTTERGLSYRILCHDNTQFTHPGIGWEEEEGTNFPLLTRGWVYQERLLSPRVLHFGPFELLWDCCESCHCECSGDRWNWVKLGYSKHLKIGTEEQLSAEWRNVASQYSCKALTEPSDKLPALSGLAKQFLQKRPNSKYLAGTWSSSILDDMIWYSNGDHNEKNARPTVWRSPSWSWVAVDDEILYPLPLQSTLSDATITRYAHIHHAESTVAGINVTGKVKAGHIIISGPTLRGRYVPRQVDGHCEYDLFFPSFSRQSNMHYRTDAALLDPEPWQRVRRSQLHLDCQDKRPIHLQRRSVDVLCLRMILIDSSAHALLEAAEYFLVLECCDQMKNVYQRVGMAVTSEEYRRGPEPNREDTETLIETREFVACTTQEKTKFWEGFLSPFDNKAANQAIKII
jgi:hypothetical protein